LGTANLIAEIEKTLSQRFASAVSIVDQKLQRDAKGLRMKAMAKKKLSAEALEFFREQGQRGGKARLKKLTPAKRSEVARKAAAARWKGKTQ